jgi:3-oxoacyl-[acyl-carrier-protein] synthase II
MAACQIAIILGIQGPTSCPVAACATGVVAIGEAFRRLQRGEIDVAIAGGTDAVTTPLAVAAFGGLGALSKRNDEPERACRPFDADRDGTVIGEGAAVVVMETLEHAVRRGAPILAQVAGYGFTEDAYHLVAPDPTGGPAAAAMSLAIRESGLAPFDLGCISAHATATPLNDVAETLAIKTALGEVAYRVPVSALKSMVGHMLGAAGAISVIVVVKTIETGIIPPTINLERPDPRCDLDYVPHTARAARVDAALANAFGFGGQNASLIVRRFGE